MSVRTGDLIKIKDGNREVVVQAYDACGRAYVTVDGLQKVLWAEEFDVLPAAEIKPVKAQNWIGEEPR
jgi:hypothetical protein